MKKPEIIEENVSLSQFTTFRVGGPARYFLIARNFNELKAGIYFARDQQIPLFFLGKGSNVLVSDSGFDGLVIKLGGDFNSIRVDENKIMCGAAALLAYAAREAAARSLSGLEWAAGIPGTAGGAVRMNAGAFGFDMSGIVESAVVLDTDALELKKYSRQQLKFGYRQSSFAASELILEVTCKLSRADREKITATMESIFNERKKRQPLGVRSAGSIFKNPPEDSAGRLIETCGLKGYMVGGAAVSEKHANFIVNTGNATAKEIYNLIRKIQQQVYEMSGVMLEPEIVMVGEFD